MALSTFTWLGNYHRHPSLELFHLVPLKRYTCSTIIPFSLLLRASGNHSSTFLVCEFTCSTYLTHISGITLHLSFCEWLMSSTDGHSDCFNLLVIVNDTVMNIDVQGSLWILTFNSFGSILRSVCSRLLTRGVAGFSVLLWLL